MLDSLRVAVQTHQPTNNNIYIMASTGLPEPAKTAEPEYEAMVTGLSRPMRKPPKKPMVSLSLSHCQFPSTGVLNEHRITYPLYACKNFVPSPSARRPTIFSTKTSGNASSNSGGSNERPLRMLKSVTPLALLQFPWQQLMLPRMTRRNNTAHIEFRIVAPSQPRPGYLPRHPKQAARTTTRTTRTGHPKAHQASPRDPCPRCQKEWPCWSSINRPSEIWAGKLPSAGRKSASANLTGTNALPRGMPSGTRERLRYSSLSSGRKLPRRRLGRKAKTVTVPRRPRLMTATLPPIQQRGAATPAPTIQLCPHALLAPTPALAPASPIRVQDKSS